MCQKFRPHRMSMPPFYCMIVCIGLLPHHYALINTTFSRCRQGEIPHELGRCPHPLPIGQLQRAPKDLRQTYVNFFHDLEKQYTKKLAPGTLVTNPQQILHPIYEGEFVLWGTAERGVLELSAFNQSSAIEGEFKNGGKAVMWKYVKPEKKDFSALTRNTTLYGDYALFLAYNFEVFAHFFLDNIGYISYLRETMPISTRFLLADAQGESRTRLETIDAEFAKRVDWIECKKQDVCNQSVKIKNGTLTILQPVSSTRHMELLLKARKWILEKNPPKAQSLTDRKIVYYTRNSPNAYHGRKMDIEQERKILQIIQETMMQFGRNETLFVFNGTQTMQEQIDIFQSANIVIGAHGGGL